MTLTPVRGAALALALLCCHAALGLWTLRTQSATYDEPMLVASGYSYWRTGNFQMDPGNLPLGKLLLSGPLIFLDPTLPSFPFHGSVILYDYMFGEMFFYWVGNDGERLLFLARCVNLALSCLLGLLIWRAVRKRQGEAPAALAAALYFFSPDILAHATLATVDFTGTFFVTVSCLLFLDFMEQATVSRALAVGLAASAALFCKHSALLLWPAFAVALALSRAKKEAVLLALWGFLPWLAVFGAYAAVEPMGLKGIAYRFHQIGQVGQPAYLFGHVSVTGWRWYYAVAVLVKSTPAELAAMSGVLWLLWHKRGRLKPETALPLALMAMYFAAASISRLQVGLRYVLPLYPMLVLLAGTACADWLKAEKGWRIFAFTLGLAQAASAVYAAPDFIPYFNAFAGGTRGGYYILGDSNLDWGQDLNRLAAYLKAQGNPEVILSYFGTAAPERLGFKSQRLYSHNTFQDTWTNSENPAQELFVISATNLQGIYVPRQDLFAWVKELPLKALVGKTLYVYDVTHDAAAHRNMARIYVGIGSKALAEHELRRAKAIEGSSSSPLPAAGL